MPVFLEDAARSQGVRWTDRCSRGAVNRERPSVAGAPRLDSEETHGG